MSDNPIAKELSFYRMAVLKFLPHLEKLDDLPVSQLEVSNAIMIDHELLEQKEGQGQKNEKTYVQTTFIPNESQQYIPLKRKSPTKASSPARQPNKLIKPFEK